MPEKCFIFVNAANKERDIDNVKIILKLHYLICMRDV